MTLNKPMKFKLNRIQILGVLQIVAFLVLMSCNAFLYKDTIVRVTKVEYTLAYE